MVHFPMWHGGFAQVIANGGTDLLGDARYQGGVIPFTCRVDYGFRPASIRGRRETPDHRPDDREEQDPAGDACF
jgi:hypothetical protein